MLLCQNGKVLVTRRMEARRGGKMFDASINVRNDKLRCVVIV